MRKILLILLLLFVSSTYISAQVIIDSKFHDGVNDLDYEIKIDYFGVVTIKNNNFNLTTIIISSSKKEDVYDGTYICYLKNGMILKLFYSIIPNSFNEVDQNNIKTILIQDLNDNLILTPSNIQ